MGTALGYTVSNRGADFSDVYATLEYKWMPDEKIEEFGLPKTIDLNSTISTINNNILGNQVI